MSFVLFQVVHLLWGKLKMKSVFPFDIGFLKHFRAVLNQYKPSKRFWVNTTVWSSLVCLFLLVACGPAPIQYPTKKASDQMTKSSAPYNQASGPRANSQAQPQPEPQPCKDIGQPCVSGSDCCSGNCSRDNACLPPG